MPRLLPLLALVLLAGCGQKGPLFLPKPAAAGPAAAGAAADTSGPVTPADPESRGRTPPAQP